MLFGGFKMKETRECIICLHDFRTKTTSNRKTCSTKCSRKYLQEYKRKYQREYKREYQQRPEVKEYQQKYQREYRQRSKLEINA